MCDNTILQSRKPIELQGEQRTPLGFGLFSGFDFHTTINPQTDTRNGGHLSLDSALGFHSSSARSRLPFLDMIAPPPSSSQILTLPPGLQSAPNHDPFGNDHDFQLPTTSYPQRWTRGQITKCLPGSATINRNIVMPRTAFLGPIEWWELKVGDEVEYVACDEHEDNLVVVKARSVSRILSPSATKNPFQNITPHTQHQQQHHQDPASLRRAHSLDTAESFLLPSFSSNSGSGLVADNFTHTPQHQISQLHLSSLPARPPPGFEPYSAAPALLPSHIPNNLPSQGPQRWTRGRITRLLRACAFINGDVFMHHSTYVGPGDSAEWLKSLKVGDEVEFVARYHEEGQNKWRVLKARGLPSTEKPFPSLPPSHQYDEIFSLRRAHSLDAEATFNLESHQRQAINNRSSLQEYPQSFKQSQLSLSSPTRFDSFSNSGVHAMKNTSLSPFSSSAVNMTPNSSQGPHPGWTRGRVTRLLRACAFIDGDVFMHHSTYAGPGDSAEWLKSLKVGDEIDFVARYHEEGQNKWRVLKAMNVPASTRPFSTNPPQFLALYGFGGFPSHSMDQAAIDKLINEYE
eukprot:c5319_g1_i1.p1 GENE.c5319_g1_i1~~c5319_g1_i1.p1  ORF type:complete len:572 (-),score=69.32 c5319_g1_i1:97-1812(-)